jgi:hypothetical protein
MTDLRRGCRRVAGELRVGLFAMDTIKKGDSLAYDYK